MANWSPPSVPRTWLAVAAALYVLVIVYSILILGQVLLGLLPGIFLVVVYVSWRLLAAIEAMADAQQRIADAQQRLARQREQE